MAKKMHATTMDFVWTQCWQLSNCIIIANELADGGSSFIKYGETERLRLAEQFAQATGIFRACVLAASEPRQQSPGIDDYRAYADDFARYGYQAAKLSGQFATEGELVEYLEKLASLTIERLGSHEIDPIDLHIAAMDTVDDFARENGTKVRRPPGSID
jgi:hypothetical protein